MNVIHQKNQGLGMARNKGIEIARGEYLGFVDSDDYLFPNAIETIESEYDKIKNKDNVCGLFGLRSNADGKPMNGRDIPAKIEYETQYNLRYIHKIEPEYVQVYKTNVINKYRYPLYKGEKYMPLSYMQDQIDQKFKFLIIHQPIMVCEYFPDGITKNQKKLAIKNPLGFLEFRRQQLEYAPLFRLKIKCAITYDTSCLIAKKTKLVLKSPHPFITFILFPIGFFDYLLRYKLKR